MYRIENIMFTIHNQIFVSCQRLETLKIIFGKSWHWCDCRALLSWKLFATLFWLLLWKKNNPPTISFCQCVIIAGFAKASIWDEVVSVWGAGKEKEKDNFSSELKQVERLLCCSATTPPPPPILNFFYKTCLPLSQGCKMSILLQWTKPSNQVFS